MGVQGLKDIHKIPLFIGQNYSDEKKKCNPWPSGFIERVQVHVKNKNKCTGNRVGTQ